MDCTHKWNFQQTVYWHGELRPGSDARTRYYADRYFCEHCLATRLSNERPEGTSYGKPLAGTVPR